jgi:hypothetical protein
MYIDDAERSAIRFDHSADIYTTLAAKKKIRSFQTETVALQKSGIAVGELNSPAGI